MAGDMSLEIFNTVKRRIDEQKELQGPMRNTVKRLATLHYGLGVLICHTKQISAMVAFTLTIVVEFFIFINVTLRSYLFFDLLMMAVIGFGMYLVIWHVLKRIRHIEKLREELKTLKKDREAVAIFQRLEREP